MDQNSRAQIRLILEDAEIRARRAVDDRLRAIYADHSSKGRLRSGATIKAALAAMEEIASEFIVRCIDRVATIAKDVEAFLMLEATVEGLLRILGGQVSDITAMAGGAEQALKSAEALFSDSRAHLGRQLEIQRFTFTVAQEARPTPLTQAPPPAKSPGGKPIAAHWDEMWAAVAVMLFTGDLQPKTQADIERAMKQWVAARDLEVGDTAIRNRARHLWRKLQAAE